MQVPVTSRAVFHFRNRTLILIASPPILILCFARILANLRSAQPWLNWLAGLVLWLFLLMLALRRKLVLTPEGLEYTAFFTTVQVPWTQVTRFAIHKTLGVWTVEGLEAWTCRETYKDLFIDLTQFDNAWKLGPLGSALRELAPKLFPEPPSIWTAA